MHLLSVRNLSKHFGKKSLFEEVDFSLSPGDKVGVVGVNGTGKTTLLNMIAGLEPPDAGQLVLNPHTRMAYLSQNPSMPEATTVLDYLFQGDSPGMQLLRAYENALHTLTQTPNDAGAQARLTTLNQRMDVENGWAAEARAKSVLTRLGLTEFGARLGSLSGGQRRRVTLAQTLIDPVDLLILDEPTNHIDPETIEWLEDYLADLKSTLILVTHDRYFLDRVVTQILEIDRGQIYTHTGNYSAYLAGKAERQANLQKLELDRQRVLKREIEWLHRAPMARGSKQQARIDRIDAMASERYATPSRDLNISIATRRTGKTVMEIKRISKQFGEQVVIRDFSYVVDRGARLGIIGPNGTGKSTLLNIIAGRLTPDQGEIAVGTTIHLGYYDQESLTLDESQRVIDYISETAEVIRTTNGTTATAAQMLDRFQFPHAMHYEYISTLSGGERRRLYLLRTLMLAPNFLLLDEPTNDLDIQTLSILEDYLETFEGVVIVASHDRYFLDRTVEHIFAFEGEGEIRQYPGNYAAYQARLAEHRSARQATLEKPSRQETPAQEADTRRSNRPRRLSYKEQRELEQLEARITALEAEKETLTAEINCVGDDYQRMQTLSETLAHLESTLEATFDRWAELSEIAEALSGN